MKVFVTGASGYIGNAVATALARAGHQVYGLVRGGAEKQALLQRAEIEPVIGDLALGYGPQSGPQSYADAARRCQVLIHCATEYSARRWALEQDTVRHLFLCASEAGERGGWQRRVIYTSGTWVYGETGDEPVDEGSALSPPALVVPRVEVEELVLREGPPQVDRLVIRPGCVYGASGGLTAAWFESAAREGAARVIGDGHFRWSMVHIEDLADLYVRAVEAPRGGLAATTLNAAGPARFTVLECARAASQAAGAGGRVRSVPLAEAVETMGPFAACLTLDQHVDAGLARRTLGWQPRHPGFVDGVKRYFTAWQARQGG